MSIFGTPLAVQWLRLPASTAGGTGVIPGRGTKILHATWWHKKKKKSILRVRNRGSSTQHVFPELVLCAGTGQTSTHHPLGASK